MKNHHARERNARSFNTRIRNKICQQGDKASVTCVEKQLTARSPLSNALCLAEVRSIKSIRGQRALLIIRERGGKHLLASIEKHQQQQGARNQSSNAIIHYVQDWLTQGQKTTTANRQHTAVFGVDALAEEAGCGRGRGGG